MHRFAAYADGLFLKIETVAYAALGLMLALAALLGLGSAGMSFWQAVEARGAADPILVTIERLLFVLMIVEILHTVRVSFRSGGLVCEPFLVVGLIASIRRVLVITLESTQINESDKWTSESNAILNSSMLELGVLGGIILIMVLSICMLRYTRRRNVAA